MNLTSFAVCSIGLTGRFILPGAPLQQLEVLNKAAEYVQKTKAEETRFMRHVKKMKGAYDICCNSDLLSKAEVNDLHFFLAIRSIISKLTKGNAPGMPSG